MWLKCDLDCCFRMYQNPEPPHLLTEVFVSANDDQMDEDLVGYDPADFAVCTATKEEWEEEVAEPYDEEEGYMGGVPVECPIFQGEVAPPWEHQKDTNAR